MAAVDFRNTQTELKTLVQSIQTQKVANPKLISIKLIFCEMVFKRFRFSKNFPGEIINMFSILKEVKRIYVFRLGNGCEFPIRNQPSQSA